MAHFKFVTDAASELNF